VPAKIEFGYGVAKGGFSSGWIGSELVRIGEIRDLLRKQPFHPFAIHSADGREFPIEHVDFLLISRSERSIVVADLRGGYEIIDPMMVRSLSVSETAAEAG
jgi:hypothetical protein